MWQRKSLSLLDIVVRNGAFLPDLELPQFELVITNLLDRIYSVVEGLPQLEPLVIGYINLVCKPTLETINEHDAFAKKAKETVQQFLHEAIEPAKTYLSKYDFHV